MRSDAEFRSEVSQIVSDTLGRMGDDHGVPDSYVAADGFDGIAELVAEPTPKPSDADTLARIREVVERANETDDDEHPWAVICSDALWEIEGILQGGRKS